jgi:hypothetical protein
MTPEERFARFLGESHRLLDESIARYVAAANAPMQQMEADLAALIRIVTAVPLSPARRADLA